MSTSNIIHEDFALSQYLLSRLIRSLIMISYQRKVHLLLEHQYLKELRNRKASHLSDLTNNIKKISQIGDLNKDTADFLTKIICQEPIKPYKSQPVSIHTNQSGFDFKGYRKQLFQRLETSDKTPQFKFSFHDPQNRKSGDLFTKQTQLSTFGNQLGSSVPDFLTTLLRKTSQAKNVKVRKRKQKIKRKPVLMIEDIVSQRRSINTQ